MRRASCLLIVIVFSAAPQGFAQSAPDASAPAVDRQFTPAPDHGRVAEPAARSSLKAQIGRVFTGAVVGGWLGYFASHLVVSDWDSGSGIGSYRGTWAAAGLVVGALAGGLTSHGTAPPDLRPGIASARQFIGRDEIVASGASNAYELIRSLRKEWLIPRGVNTFRAADHIVVYLNSGRLGGTQQLEDVGVEALGRIEFVEAAEAVFRWGSGHSHGVILLLTLPLEVGR